MSDTPRTDAATWQTRTPGDPMGASVVYRSFAEGLERELAAAQAEIARLKAGGCARDQRTTQFCAEALTLQQENAKIQDRVKRLVALGNNMADHYGDVAIDSDDDKRIDDWRRAAEDIQ